MSRKANIRSLSNSLKEGMSPVDVDRGQFIICFVV